MKNKSTPRKRLAKIFLTYALVSTALFGAGYGIQTVVNNTDKHKLPEVSAPATTQQKIGGYEARTPVKYSWGLPPRP
ncbi:MAG: hypothetical protein PSY14_08115 [bacterium]|nr:hypothetical protein [bacterium]